MPDAVAQRFRQRLIVCRVGIPAQNAGGLRGQQRHVEILRVRHQRYIGAAPQIFRIVGVQRQPIAVMGVRSPAHVVPVHAGDIVHPGRHGSKLILQDRSVAVEAVERPGNDAGRVAPGGGAALNAEVGDHVGHHAVPRLLLRPDVVQIFSEERIAVPLKAGGRREDLRVAGPAHALIPLGAVRGHVDEVAPLPPFDVGDQLVDQRVPGGQAARSRKGRMQHQRSEVLGLEVGNALDLHISITVEGELRCQNVRLAVGDIEVFRPRAAQVVPVEIPVLQDLPEL